MILFLAARSIAEYALFTVSTAPLAVFLAAFFIALLYLALTDLFAVVLFLSCLSFFLADFMIGINCVVHPLCGLNYH